MLGKLTHHMDMITKELEVELVELVEQLDYLEA